MVLRVVRLTLVAAAVIVAFNLIPSNSPQAFGRERPPYDLFYNFYVPPGPSGGVGAELYVSPQPTPPYVGHTWITYQPFLPHEFLYHHCRTYFRQHADGRWTKTKVIWK
jgi:hypothetical protein